MMYLPPMSCTLKPAMHYDACACHNTGIYFVTLSLLVSVVFHIWLHLRISSSHPSLSVCRCQTWLGATTGRRSQSGPPWTPGSWRNAAQRYINHLGETKLLVQHFTINSQIISHLLCLFYYCDWSKQVKWNCVVKAVSLLPGRTAPCRTVSLWTEACCSCCSSTAACCPLCLWERVYCSSTCRASSTGVAAGVCVCACWVCVCVHACLALQQDPSC